MNWVFRGLAACLLYALAALPLGLTGCKTAPYTAFAPLEIRLEPMSGGARRLLLLNASPQDLHHLTGMLYVWNDRNHELRRQYTREYYVANCPLGPGQTVTFKSLRWLREIPVVEPVTAVEFVGHCDEGAIKEAWRSTLADQLQRIPATPAGKVAVQPH